MNKRIILGSAIAAMTLNPLTASAISDNDPYPAAYFQPKVIYLDKEAARQLSVKPERKKAEFDPKYPAANFEPKVIFPAPET